MNTVMPRIEAVAPWFGSNRSLAYRVGELLDGCRWVGVPFAGGVSELLHLKANQVLVSDLHRHVINLATVISSDRERLQQRLDDLPFHPDTLGAAQDRCREIEEGRWARLDDAGRFDWAVDYFVCAWMSRSATAGTANEFTSSLATRWVASGGDSVVRFRNATESLTAWQQVMRRCQFVCMDFFDFMAKVHDKPECGIYCDPPFPGPGDAYKHRFGVTELRRMAAALSGFKAARVVCRFYDHPLIRELYPEDLWTWHMLEGGKTQTNKAAPEVLLVNRTEVDRG